MLNDSPTLSEMRAQRYVFLGQAREGRDSAALLLERIPQALGTALLREAVSLNLSYFVARQISRGRGIFPRRCRAHRLQRREPRRWLLVLIGTIFDLLQTTIN